MTPAERSSLTGILLAIAAFALLSSADTVFKIISAQGHPVYQILLINGCFAVILIFIWAMMTGGLNRVYTQRPLHHLIRGSVSVLSGFAAVYSYSRLPLTDFYAIVFAGPLIVTALSSFWLGEKIGGERWFAIMAGLAGILIVIAPGHAHDAHIENSDMLIGRFAAFVSVFCYALSVVMIRYMRLGETNLSFSFYGYVAALTICGVLYLAYGAPIMPLHDVLLLIVSGMMAGISSICLMTAYHRTPVALVAPFQYTQIIWGALAGYVLWAQTPSIRLVLGAAIVAASGLFVIYREFRTRENR